jgi:hypothetical protein
MNEPDTITLRERLTRVDASLAKQLRTSPERNFRMTKQLQDLHDRSDTPIAIVAAIEQILKAPDDA